MSDEMKKQMNEKESIEGLISNAKKTTTYGKLIGIAGVILALLLVWIGQFKIYSPTVIFLGKALLIVAIVAGVLISAKGKKLLKSELSEGIIPEALGEVFQNVQYFPKKYIDIETVKKTDMGFPISSFDYVEGSDLIQGTYKDVPFTASDLQLRVDSIDSQENPQAYTVFRGTWLTCDFKKRLSADVIISENKKQKKPSKHTILTDNDAFNVKYTIKSDNPEEVFYILTPHMMEFILAMDEKADGMTYFHFERNGKVHIAIDSGRDLFEIGKASAQSYEGLKQQIKDEVQYIVSLIDELKLSDSLFEENITK